MKAASIRLCVTLVLFFSLSHIAISQSRKSDLTLVGKALFKETVEGNLQPRAYVATHLNKDNPRLVAIALDASLGIFGMHRIYLGTDAKVPVFYTLTLGGGMVLWIADLVLLITTEDITKFMNNPNVFMWNDKKL